MKAVAVLLSTALLAGPVGFASSASAQTEPAPAATPAPCTPQHGINFICGMVNVEDMLPVDGGKSVVAGSYKDGSVGFYLIDTATKTAKVVALSVAAKPDPLYDCPGAPDLTKLSTHGLDVRPGRNGAAVLYAINHGGRESVEVFNLDARKGSAEWVGCVVAPEGTSANSVVGLPDRSIVFTKLFDTRERGAGMATGISPVLQGKITGLVYHWVPGKGISVVPGSELSGDNGLLASPNGKTLYINAYGTKEIWRVPLDGRGQKASAKVELPSSDAEYLHNPKAPYPLLSQRRNEQGRVVVEVLIGVDGLALKAQIKESSGYARLDQQALSTVLSWHYVPGKRGGVPQAMTYSVPINFVLE